MKLQSLVLSLILIARHLAVRAQEQATEDANADDPLSNNWQSEDTTNMADEFSTVSDDDGAETNTTAKQQNEWRVTERSTIENNQETIAVDLNTMAMLQNHSDNIATVTEPFYQYEMSHASLTPMSIISTEAITSKTSHQATQRQGLTTLETTLSNSANGLPSIAAEEVTRGINAGSTNNNNFIEVTVDISDATQRNDVNEFATVSQVSVSSMDSGTTTIQLPIFSTEETQQTWSTTLRPTKTTTVHSISSNAAESPIDVTDGDNANNHYFTEVTVTEPDVSEEGAASEIATTLQASVYSVNSDATTAYVVNASADEMPTSSSTTSELTKANTASGISTNAAEQFTDGSDVDHTKNDYFSEVTFTKPGAVTNEHVASEIITASLNSMYNIDNGATTTELTYTSAEEMQWATSTTLEPTKTSTQRGTSSNSAGDFTDGADGTNTGNQYLTEVTVTEPDYETGENAFSETVTTPFALMHSADGATTVEVTHASAEAMQQSMSTALEPIGPTIESGTSSNVAEEFTNGIAGNGTNNHYFTEATLTEPGDQSSGNAASETVTESPALMYSSSNDAATVKVTHVSAEEMQRSMSTALEPTRMTPESGASSNAAEEFTAGAEDDSTSNHFFTEETLTKPGATTEENVASETMTESLTVVYSIDSGATTVELTHSSVEETRWSRSTTSKPTETSTESGISSNTAEEFTSGADGDGTSNHYFTEVTLTKSGDHTASNVASEIVTASLASAHSFGNDAATVEATHTSAEEMLRSMSTAFEPAETSAMSDITSNAAEERTHGTDGDSTNKPLTEVALTDSGDQTEGNIASVTIITSLASMYSADSAATTSEMAYSSAEETQWSRSTTSKPTRSTTVNSISSNTVEEFTDGTDVASSINHYFTEATFTEADKSDGNVASETATASVASMYSVGSSAKTIEVTSALAEEMHWSMSTTSEPTDIITARGISLNTADELTVGTVTTQLHDGYSTDDSYVTEVKLTKPDDETEGNVVSETVTAPLASMYTLGSDVATIKVTYASAETAQQSSSMAVEAEITSNAISMSSSIAAEFTDDTNGGSTDNKYFTVVTLTNSGDESDGNVDSQATTAPLASMSSIDSGAATAEVSHTPTYEAKRSSLTTLELVSVTNTNIPSSNAVEWSPGVSNDNGVGSSYVAEQASTANNDVTDGYISNNFSSPSLDSMSSDGKTATTIDFSAPSVENVQWSKTTVLEGKGTTLVNALSSSTEERSLFFTSDDSSDDSSFTEATLADRGSTIENLDASATPTAETDNGLEVSRTNPSSETITTPTRETSSLGPTIDNDTLAEIRRNNSVVVSLSMSLAEYTKDFDYKFRSAVAQAANDYCKRNSCYGSGSSSNSSSGDEGNGGRPRVRRAAVTPAPASPTASGSTMASPVPGAASATTLSVLFTIADVGILPGYPVSNGLGGIDVATYLSPPAGLASSVGSANAFIIVSGEVLVAIISANQVAVADALGVNITGVIRLPEKIALDAATSTKVTASIAASTAAESSAWVPLVASLVSVVAVLLVIAAAVLIVKKLKRQGSASVSPSITKLNVDDRPSTSASGDMWYAAGSTEVISHAHRNRNLLEELDVSTSMWYESSLPKEASMGRRRVYRIARDVPTLQYSPPEDTSYFQCISPPPSYSVLSPIRDNR